MKQPTSGPSVSRREALKSLVAALGATSLMSLPDQWEKPLIEVARLPAHAQASPVDLTIDELAEQFTGTNDCTIGSGDTGSSSLVRFSYTDALGQVDSGVEVIERFVFNPDGLTGSRPVIFTIDGNGSQGEISYTNCSRFNGDTSVTIRVELRTADGRRSNSLSLTTTAPPGAQEEGRSGGRS